MWVCAWGVSVVREEYMVSECWIRDHWVIVLWLSGEHVKYVVSACVYSECMSMCECMVGLWWVREYMTNVWSARERMMSVWLVFESVWVHIGHAWSMVNQCVRHFIFVGKFSQWWWGNGCVFDRLQKSWAPKLKHNEIELSKKNFTQTTGILSPHGVQINVFPGPSGYYS